MATYKIGSSGDEVRRLQEQLNANGANLTVDGVYGQNTANAVRQYQSANGLSVDGIAGVNTMAKLNGTASASGTAQPAQKTTAQILAEYEANRPADYASQYQAKIDTILGQINDRQPFRYDFSTDPMYRMYEEKYQQQGKKAMEDTMARANANSGGYGSSYAQAVGQQTYDSYLTNLNDIIPTLQNEAYQQYQTEGDDLRQQYALLADLENQAYNRYQDDYDKWAADRNYWYQRQQDEIAQANWEKEFQLAQQSAARSSGGGGGGSYRSSGTPASTPTATATPQNTQSVADRYASAANSIINAARAMVSRSSGKSVYQKEDMVESYIKTAVNGYSGMSAQDKKDLINYLNQRVMGIARGY